MQVKIVGQAVMGYVIEHGAQLKGFAMTEWRKAAITGIRLHAAMEPGFSLMGALLVQQLMV